MTELLEIELTDEELETLDAAGGCAGTTLGLGGLHLSFGHHLTLGFGGGFGFYGGPVVVSQPVTAVQLVPMTQTVVAGPVAQTVGVTGVQATSCGVQTLTAGC